MSIASCLNCRFVLRVDDQESYCRRHAPVVMVPEGYRAPVTRSPSTYDQNWCGDHEPMPSAELAMMDAIKLDDGRTVGEYRAAIQKEYLAPDPTGNEWNQD